MSSTNVRDFFFLLFTHEKKICLWTLWIFLWPLATQNFKIGFSRKCSSHSWTGEKRSLTVGRIFFTRKRDNHTNKVLYLIGRKLSLDHSQLTARVENVTTQSVKRCATSSMQSRKTWEIDFLLTFFWHWVANSFMTVSILKLHEHVWTLQHKLKIH